MRYDISKATAPAMPFLGKGTECIKLLLSQASKDMFEPLVPMFFPSLGAHISGAEFRYPDRSWKEMYGLKANLVGDSGCNKGQLTDLVKAICRAILARMGVSPRAQTLPPRAVEYVVEDYCIDVPEEMQ